MVHGVDSLICKTRVKLSQSSHQHGSITRTVAASFVAIENSTLMMPHGRKTTTSSTPVPMGLCISRIGLYHRSDVCDAPRTKFCKMDSDVAYGIGVMTQDEIDSQSAPSERIHEPEGTKKGNEDFGLPDYVLPSQPRQD